MGDSDLDQIRQRRMMEMMAQQQGQGGGQGMTADQAEEQEDQRRNQEEQRRSMLVALMTSEARERLSRIALVKPDKARGVEAMVLQLAQRGQLSEKVSDERLMAMLEQISEREGSSKPKITVTRRRPLFEDD